MKPLLLVITGFGLIIAALLHEQIAKQRRAERKEELRAHLEADAARTRARHAAEQAAYDEQTRAIQRISERRMAEIEADFREQEHRQKLAENWKWADPATLRQQSETELEKARTEAEKALGF